MQTYTYTPNIIRKLKNHGERITFSDKMGQVGNELGSNNTASSTLEIECKQIKKSKFKKSGEKKR